MEAFPAGLGFESPCPTGGSGVIQAPSAWTSGLLAGQGRPGTEPHLSLRHVSPKLHQLLVSLSGDQGSTPRRQEEWGTHQPSGEAPGPAGAMVGATGAPRTREWGACRRWGGTEPQGWSEAGERASSSVRGLRI